MLLWRLPVTLHLSCTKDVGNKASWYQGKYLQDDVMGRSCPREFGPGEHSSLARGFSPLPPPLPDRAAVSMASPSFHTPLHSLCLFSQGNAESRTSRVGQEPLGPVPGWLPATSVPSAPWTCSLAPSLMLSIQPSAGYEASEQHWTSHGRRLPLWLLFAFCIYL